MKTEQERNDDERKENEGKGEREAEGHEVHRESRMKRSVTRGKEKRTSKKERGCNNGRRGAGE